MLIVKDEYPLSENISNCPSIHFFGQPKYFVIAAIYMQAEPLYSSNSLSLA